MGKKLKAGVIGLGMGGAHLGGYLAHPDVEVVAIADRREDRRALLPVNHPTFKGKVYHEGMEMIEKEKLDIVSVAVPNNHHFHIRMRQISAQMRTAHAQADHASFQFFSHDSSSFKIIWI